MQLAVLKIKKIRDRHNHERVVFYRLQAAEDNLEGWKQLPVVKGDEVVAFKKVRPAPSFRRPFFIAETGDHTSLSEKTMGRFLERLRWLGFTHIKWFDQYDSMEPHEI